jgi:predicted nucleic-acid-binding Zn-ribbon protein
MFNDSSDVASAISERFICAKCKGAGADVQSLAMTGTGLSRLLDFQRHSYVFASCLRCGYTEVFNARIIETSRGHGMDVLDLLFGN